MKDQITNLQDQVNGLFSNMSDLRARQQQSASIDPSNLDTLSRDGQSVFTPMQQPGSTIPRTRYPRFQGPTSSAFNFDVARSSLQNMGIAPAEDTITDDLTTAHATPAGSPLHPPPPPPPTQLPPVMSAMHPSKDPIWSINREEALRLCRVYEEEIGIMYPLVDIEKVTQQINLLYTFMEAALRTGFAQRALPGSDGLQDDNTNILKMILAVTLIVEGSGQSDLGQRLYLSMKPVIESKLWEPLDIRTIQLYGLVVSLSILIVLLLITLLQATYHFHTDDDAMAYRVVGLAARMCFELGLHRRDALKVSFPIEDQWPDVSKVFWSVYILDRRWSLGTGLPFGIQDEDIDPNLPGPVSFLWYLSILSLAIDSIIGRITTVLTMHGLMQSD